MHRLKESRLDLFSCSRDMRKRSFAFQDLRPWVRLALDALINALQPLCPVSLYENMQTMEFDRTSQHQARLFSGKTPKHS
jgi:hypothetical protein